MKTKQSVIETRRKKIHQLLMKNGVVWVNALAQEMGASPLTIRRDLEYFDSIGTVERFYGGATLVQPGGNDGENIFSSNLIFHKHAIAQRAAGFVEDGDTIFINTSSTALLLLKYITARQVTVITNNAKAIFSEKKDDMIVCLTGGEMRMPKEAMVGDFAINNLNRVTATKCFLGCNGLSAAEGITTAVLQEAAINELMIRRVVGPRVILADNLKIGRTNSFTYGSVQDISYLITDSEVAPKALAQIVAVNPSIHVMQVEPLKLID